MIYMDRGRQSAMPLSGVLFTLRQFTNQLGAIQEFPNRCVFCGRMHIMHAAGQHNAFNAMFGKDIVISRLSAKDTNAS